MKWDFSGWATRNDIRCSDGRTIRKDAFAENDGQIVPLVWNHQQNDPTNVLGHALLVNKPEGVFAYGKFNDTEKGQHARTAVYNRDVTGLSIYANKLKQKGGDVMHGVIREVSLVLAGANPGALIETLSVEHSEDGEGEAYIYSGDEIELYHADEDGKEDDMAEQEEKKEEKTEEKGKTIGEIFDSLTEDQRKAVDFVVGKAVEAALKDKNNEDDDEEDSENMKHNVFDNDNTETRTTLTPDDFAVLMADAKRAGSLREAVLMHMEEGGVLAHAEIPTEGMDLPTGQQNYGFRDPNFLFPEARTLNNTPEWIKRDDAWVSKVMAGVHRTPFSRVKSVFANITEDEARAKGYIKGRLKKEEVFSLLKRTTDPQTIYKKQKMDRDDIVDITSFDVVAWIRGEMRIMLNEEIARAILIGDGRLDSSDDKISEDHVRPIVNDKPLFTVKVPVDVTKAKNFIDGAIRARKNYKGSGSPTLFTTEDMLTEMLLIEDQIGHKLYKTEAELATALRVKEIVTVEVMENAKVPVNGVSKDLLGIIVNLADYNVGADKGGEINMFDDFDIDYNQYKYLLETRISGALVKPFSALVFYKEPASASSNTDSEDTDNHD